MALLMFHFLSSSGFELFSIICHVLVSGRFHIDLWQQLELISVGLVNVPTIVFFWVGALVYHLS